MEFSFVSIYLELSVFSNYITKRQHVDEKHEMTRDRFSENTRPDGVGTGREAIADGYFDEELKCNLCYCESCHKLRGDEAYYKRGDPPKDYALPFGWCRFALRLNPRCEVANVYKKWHTAYHGTCVGSLRRTLDHGELVSETCQDIEM
eukprot:g36514.t1